MKYLVIRPSADEAITIGIQGIVEPLQCKGLLVQVEDGFDIKRISVSAQAHVQLKDALSPQDIADFVLSDVTNQAGFPGDVIAPIPVDDNQAGYPGDVIEPIPGDGGGGDNQAGHPGDTVEPIPGDSGNTAGFNDDVKPLS